MVENEESYRLAVEEVLLDDILNLIQSIKKSLFEGLGER